MVYETQPDFLVTKRSGRQECFDAEKIHRVLNWAAKGLENISISQIEIQAKIQFFNGIQTEEIHKMLIKSSADLISEEGSDYQYLAARLLVFSLRKKVYGAFEPWSALEQVRRMVKMGSYTPELLELYSEEEWAIMDGWLGQHERDFLFSYVSIKQLEGKYLIQDRTCGKIYETPQFLYLFIAATLFALEPREERLERIKAFYESISTFELSLPTPIMAGVRTTTRQYSSCVLIECGDSLRSINATASSIVTYVSQRSGLGINAGRIRALGSPVRGGEVFHTGCIPFYKYFQAAVKSCSQGGLRGGAATLFFPLWHLEAESLMVLKNNRGIEENRVRHMDYAVQINRFMYQRLQQGKLITLFCPSEVPDLYEAFFQDQALFEHLYETYEADPQKRKRQVPATQLFSNLAQERISTGRIYIQHVDHCNTHTPFQPLRAPIRQSNLCMEVLLPTSPLGDPKEEEMALCILGAVNLGKIQKMHDLIPLTQKMVYFLDTLLDRQSYLLPSAARSALLRRPLGIGVVNFAYHLARSGRRYSDGSALQLTHETFETLQYGLLRASCDLAKLRGACEAFEDTTYAQGLLPIDHYKREVDEFADFPLLHDWEGLRADIQRYGLRNSTLSCQMPCETSSQVLNATNGIEPPRGHVSIKASKDGLLKQVVPDYKHAKQKYELLWDLPDNQGILQLTAIMQKFMDQAISVNLNYDPSKFEQGRVPVKRVLQDLLMSHRLGLKNLYYHNTRDGMRDPDSGDSSLSESHCGSGACAI